MKTLRWMGLGSSLLLVLAGCAGNSSPEATQPTTPQGGTAPVAENGGSKQTFPQPLVPGKEAAQKSAPTSTETLAQLPSQKPAVVPGITPSTQPEQRAMQVVAGRNDPFAAVIDSPVVVVTKRPTLQPVPVPPPPVLAPTGALTKLPALKPMPLGLKPMPLKPVGLPSLGSVPVAAASETNMAQAIEVSGLVKIGSQVHAMVKVPQEATARTVRPGDYLANGQVLVKRIEMPTDGEPRLILEERGLEVIKFVGNSGTAIARVP